MRAVNFAQQAASFMKIHSSSLNVSPLGFNPKAGKNNTQNKDQNVPLVEQTAQNKKTNKLSSPEEIEKTLNSLDLTNQDTIIKPTDLHTLRALSAYNEQFNALLQEQRAQLLTGIDAYV